MSRKNFISSRVLIPVAFNEKNVVDELNLQLPKVAQLKKFRILGEELDIDENEVTPTMKVKSRTLDERYRHLIKEMYA